MKKDALSAATRKTTRPRQGSRAPLSGAPAAKNGARAIIIGEHIHLPLWVVDHQSYRQWACSDDFPERGWVSYINDAIWVDPSMERLIHNQIKTLFAIILGGMVLREGWGRYLGDRMLLTNISAGLSTEPDGMFVSKESLRTGRVVFGKGDDTLEVLGTPDMTLEVVSRTSVRKDTVELLEAYWRAGIAEYWLVDPRGTALRFDIFRRGPTKYVAARHQDGWVKSVVFAKAFRLVRQMGSNGISEYSLEVR